MSEFRLMEARTPSLQATTQRREEDVLIAQLAYL